MAPNIAITALPLHPTYEAMDIYALIAKGDQKAMSYLFRQYYSRLLYFAQSIIHQQEEAEDLAMKALSSLWETAITQSRWKTVDFGCSAGVTPP